jgi:flagellar L-ring protein precursor FlgH
MKTKWYFLLLLLAGCNTDPSTSVRQPMTIRPNPQAPITQGDGAIYHVSNSRPMFEDRRARFVGDTLTVTLVEKNTGSTSGADSFNRTGSTSVAVGTPTILGYTPKMPFAIPVPGANNNFGPNAQPNLNTSFSATSAIKSANTDANTNTNAFSGSITVTVIEVLPNGNLEVSGEKQIAVNSNTEFIRLSGVVNPINITGSNTVSSTQVADARIETKEKQSLDTSQVISMLSRFFVALLPF